MNLVQAPPGAVPFVPLGAHTPLQIETYMQACALTLTAYRKADQNILPTSQELALAVTHKTGSPVEDVIRAIEELRGEGTLLMLPDGRLLYCSDE